MKFALFNDERIEATKGAKGKCPCCGSGLIAKCGEVYIHHWAHKKKCNDHWWENETEWHRNWKNKFPKEWQEVIHKDESGEKHIADVKTNEDWVIEFQHSAIKPEERDSRDYFYNKLIWVVDGMRRKTDVKQFQKIFDKGDFILDKPSLLLLYIDWPFWSKLLMEWRDSNSLILLDFNDRFSSNKDLWLIYPKNSDNNIYLSQLSRNSFIKYLNSNRFNDYFFKIINLIQKAIEDSIKANKKRNMKLKSAMRHTEMKSFPDDILGTIKLPDNILSKIKLPSNFEKTR